MSENGHIKCARERNKVMEGLKKEETLITRGFQTYYDFVKSHMALNGKTPAEACGITVEGKNKWITLIQNASRN